MPELEFPLDLLVQGDRRESDGFQKKKKLLGRFQLEMDVFLQN